MDYCRVDYDNCYEYLENDTPVYFYEPFKNKPTIIEYRNASLLKNNYKYNRIKRLKALPPGKKINTLYHKG